MRSIKKGVIWFFLISVVLVLLVLLYLYVTTRNPTSGTIRLTGLNGQVTIHRDDYGVPHIVATTNDNDAYFALGYVTAEDRLWQLEFQRRIVNGTLSQLFGTDVIEIDKYFRTLGLYNRAKASLPLLAPKTRDAINAYTNGINAFLATGNFPLQFKLLNIKPAPWSASDVISAQKLVAFGLSNLYDQQWENHLALLHMDLDSLIKLRGIYPLEAPTTAGHPNNQPGSQLPTPSQNTNRSTTAINAITEKNNNAALVTLKNEFNFLKPGKGSNAWVVDGSKTLSGKPILASDPHLDFSMPGIWYLAELTGPQLHVTGATTPGIPFVLIGHNTKAAWGITYAGAEISTLKMISPNAPIHVVHERIDVKGGDPLDYVISVSLDGPIINDFLQPKPQKGELVALSSTLLSEADTSSEAFFQFAMASEWTAFRQAASLIVSPALNLIYADESGTIGYQLAGKIPLRHRHDARNNAYLPTKADESTPLTYIPFEKLPSITNPASHVLISANNKIVTDEYPYLLTRYWEVPPYRAERITQLLEQKSKSHPLTMEDMKAIQQDAFSLIWQSMKPLLLKSTITGDNHRQALEQLKQWDGNMGLADKGATIFSYWLNELRHELSDSFHLSEWEMEPLSIYQLIKKNELICTDSASCNLLVSRTFSNAVDKIHHDLGSNSDNWQWGRVHHALFKEPALGEVFLLEKLWNRSIPTPGGDSTVNVGLFNPESFTQTMGVSYRQIIDFGDLSQGIYITPTGQSDDLFSANRGNLMPLWQKGDYIHMTPSRQPTASMTLLPK